MRNSYIKLFIVQSFLFFCISNLHSYSRFSSRSSQLRIAGNAQFNVGTPSFSIKKGEMNIGSSSIVTGESILLDGVLSQGVDGAEIEVKGRFDPAGGSFGTIYLEGDSKLDVTKKGIVRSNVVVTGNNNRIRGNAFFGGNVTLADVTSQVTLDLESPLNRTIDTPGGGGRIDLARDTTFADGVDLIEGDIAFNGHRLSLGGKTLPYTKTTRFIRGADLVLNGKTELDGGTWIFIEDGVVNANGNLIDLKNGGTVTLGSTTTLQLTNAVVRNVAQDSMLFTDSSSGIELSSAVFEVSSTMTTTTGKVSVVGQSTVVIKDGSWTLTDQATFAVDGVSALIDTSVNPNPNALITDAKFSNNGAIHYLFMDSIVYLFSGVHTSTIITITTSFIIPQGESMVFGASTTIDGLGGSIIFTNPDNPQIILLPNTQIYFENISLENIGHYTFSLDATSTIFFGKNTYLEISTDITFTQGHYVFASEGGSVIIQGRLFNLLELAPGANVNHPLFELGTSTLVLENILLSGVQYISYATDFVNGQLITGGIALAGNTLIDIDTDIDMYFIVEKFNNYLRFKKPDLRLRGGVSYEDTGENELIFTFLDSTINYNFPRVYLADNYFYLGSTLGRAHLLIDAFGAEIFNEGTNSFVFDIGGVLEGQNLIVNNYPIKLLSTLIDIQEGMNLFSDQPNAIESSFVRRSIDLDDEQKDVDELVRAVTNKKKKQRTTIPPLNPTLYTNTIQLGDASGEIILQSGEIKKFGISGSTYLNLTLKDGAILDLNAASVNPIILKSDDILNIEGTGNIIRVNRDFVLQGSLLFAEGSNLTIEFENDSFMVVDRDITLEAGIEMACKGDGRLILSDGKSIILKQAITGQRSTELAFEDKALLSVDFDGTGYIRGNGLIKCYNTGGISLDIASTLAIGLDTTDNLTLDIYQGQMHVGIDDAATDAYARISFGYGAYSIKNRLHGSISLGNHGIIECNIRNGSYIGGRFESLAVELGGFLFVDTGGRLILGENNTEKLKKTPYQVTVNTESSFIRGDGMLEYVTKKGTQFEARLGNINSALYFNNTKVSLLDWLYKLAQQSNALKTVLLYTDANFNQFLRFSNGTVVSLGTDDEILRELSNGSIVVYNHENDDQRTYKSNGVLI